MAHKALDARTAGTQMGGIPKWVIPKSMESPELTEKEQRDYIEKQESLNIDEKERNGQWREAGGAYETLSNMAIINC